MPPHIRCATLPLAMDLDADDLVKLFDRVGIVAFAFSGVEVGARRRLDVFGLLVMGLVTATGGGVVRDLILVRLPFVVDHEDYFLWAAVASAVAIIVVWTNRKIPPLLVSVADAVGLGAFAAAGALAAIAAGLGLVPAVLLAVITGTGGGVIRDLLADRVPLVLRSEVNATAAALGGLAVWAIEPVSAGLAALIGATATALVRVAGLAFNINLPVPGRH